VELIMAIRPQETKSKNWNTPPSKGASDDHIKGISFNWRNSLSADSWLGDDYCSKRLNMWGGAAWFSSLVASLALLPE
jgi:hypothetical protein